MDGKSITLEQLIELSFSELYKISGIPAEYMESSVRESYSASQRFKEHTEFIRTLELKYGKRIFE